MTETRDPTTAYILPRMGDFISGWDSASREVSYDAALDLFEADLDYLRSDDLRHHLPASCAAARVQVEANISTTRLHSRFGTGSKVSKWQYYKLIAATAGGWAKHLQVLGAFQTIPRVEEGEVNPSAIPSDRARLDNGLVA